MKFRNKIILFIILLLVAGLIIFVISMEPPPPPSLKLIKFGFVNITQQSDGFKTNSYSEDKKIKIQTTGAGKGDIQILRNGFFEYRIVHAIAGKNPGNGKWYLTPLRNPSNASLNTIDNFIFWNDSNTSYPTYEWGIWDNPVTTQAVYVNNLGFICNNQSNCNLKLNATVPTNLDDRGGVYIFFPKEPVTMYFKIAGKSEKYNFTDEYTINTTGAKKFLYLYDEWGNLYNFNFSDLNNNIIAEVRNISGKMGLLVGTNGYGGCTDPCIFKVDPETTMFEEMDFWEMCNYPPSGRGVFFNKIKCYYIDKIGGNIVSNFRPNGEKYQEFAWLELEAKIENITYNFSAYNKLWWNQTGSDEVELKGATSFYDNYTNSIQNFSTYFMLESDAEMLFINTSIDYYNARMSATHYNITISFDAPDDGIIINASVYNLNDSLNLTFGEYSGVNEYYMFDHFKPGSIYVNWTDPWIQAKIIKDDVYYNAPVKLYIGRNYLDFWWTDASELAASFELAFFLASEAGRVSASGSDGTDQFDESPIILNDYGNSTEKCQTWNCTGWTAGATADKMNYCTGGWNCSVAYGTSCQTMRCNSWTQGTTARRMTYCSGDWICLSMTGNYCNIWNCSINVGSGWTEYGTNDADIYCSGVWDCISYTGNECTDWDCTVWSGVPVLDDDDVYCQGLWDCTNWISGVCDRYNCTLWAQTVDDKFDAYCGGQWNCSEWSIPPVGSDPRCDKWNCTSMTITGTNNFDNYCNMWNCSFWTANEVCQTWKCNQWIQGATTDIDYYCSIFNCTQWIVYDSYPYFTDNKTNNTNPIKSLDINFSIIMRDDVGIAAHRFCFDSGGGSFVCDGWVTISPASQPINNWTIRKMTGEAGQTVRWYWEAQDSRTQQNNTETWSFILPQTVAVSSPNAIPRFPINYTGVNISALVSSTSGIIGNVTVIIFYPNGTGFENRSMQKCTGLCTTYYNYSNNTPFYPHGTYNITIWANDSYGNINQSEKTWYAPTLNLSQNATVIIDGLFSEWGGFDNITDPANDGWTSASQTVNMGDAYGDANLTADVSIYNRTLIPGPSFLDSWEFFIEWNISWLDKRAECDSARAILYLDTTKASRHTVTIQRINNQSASIINDAAITLDGQPITDSTDYAYSSEQGVKQFSITSHCISEFDGTQKQKFIYKGYNTFIGDVISDNKDSLTDEYLNTGQSTTGGSIQEFRDRFASDDYTGGQGGGDSFHPLLVIDYHLDFSAQDFTSFQVANNASDIYFKIETRNNLSFNDTWTDADGTFNLYYRIYIGINGTDGVTSTPEGYTLPFANSHYLTSYNNSLWKVWQRGGTDINILNLTKDIDFNFTGNQIEFKINYSKFGLRENYKINISLETVALEQGICVVCTNPQIDLIPDYSSFIEYTIKPIPSGIVPKERWWATMMAVSKGPDRIVAEKKENIYMLTYARLLNISQKFINFIKGVFKI